MLHCVSGAALGLLVSACQKRSASSHIVEKLSYLEFVGSTEFQPGIWIGIEYDEPLGKNNGTVQGVEYFKCGPNYGAFVRPTRVTVGDFPEEDLFDTDDELEEM
jgi:tubulin-specific chaperone B